MTHASMPKMFVKEVSVLLMAQLTKAVVVEHMLLQNKPTSRYLNIFYVIYFRKIKSNFKQHSSCDHTL